MSNSESIFSIQIGLWCVCVYIYNILDRVNTHLPFLFIKFTDIIMSHNVNLLFQTSPFSPNLLALNIDSACFCQLNYRYLISAQPEATRRLVNTMDILSGLKK